METGKGAAGGGVGARFAVPFLRHHGFVGREDDLARIHALLQKGKAVGVQPVAAVGMGGIGKTQIAVEYAYRYAADYPGGVYWVNAAMDVQTELARLADDLGLREDGAESERRRRLVLAFAREIGGREDALVIFDNVEDPRTLANDAGGLVPAQMRCRVLFTTRKRDDARGTFAMVPVGALPEDEALALLGKDAEREWGSEEQVARDVCRIVGCLPLALALAGGFLKDNPEVGIGAYRDRLKREGALAIDAAEPAEDLPTRHDEAIEATLRVSWDATAKLPGGGDAERLMMMAAALLGEAVEVPRARLALLTGLGDVAVDGHPAKLAAALRRLAALSLVEELGPKAIRLHPLVRAFAERRIEGLERFGRACAGRLGEVLWDMPRLHDAVAARGVDAVLEDLRAGARIGGVEAAAWLGRLIRVLDREAHCLRRWDPVARPAFLLQQVRNKCFELGEDEVCTRAEQALTEGGKGWLRERVRVSRESEALVRTLEGHTSFVNGVAVTPDGRYAVSASYDNTLKVWDLGSGQVVRTLEGHDDRVTCAAVTPDGRYAVSASWDNTLKVWDLGNGLLVRTLEGHDDRVTCAAVTPDGRYAVSASDDKTLKMWDLGSGQLVRTLEGHRERVNGVAVTPDGRYAVSASHDNTLKVWDLGNGQLVRTLEGHTSEMSGVSVTPDGRYAVSASYGTTLKVWDLGSGQLVRTLAGHTHAVSGAAVTPDGRYAVSASWDRTLKVWDLGSGQLVRTLEGHTHAVSGVAVTPDGRYAVSASADKMLKVWDLGSGQVVRTLDGHASSVSGAAVTPDGRYAVSASHDNTLKMWDLGSGQLVRTLYGHMNWVTGVAVTPDGRYAVSASHDNTLKVWDLGSGKLVRTLYGHTNWVTGVAVTPDGRYAVSASGNKTLKVWDLGSGTVVRTLRGHGDVVIGVTVTPDGRYAVSASDDSGLKVRHLGSGLLIRTLEGHTDKVTGAAVTPDGRYAVSASHDKMLKVWDLGSGLLVRTLEGHTNWVTGAAVTPDGRYAVSTSADTTLVLWDLATGHPVAALEAHAPLQCCAAGPGGTFLAGDEAGALHIIDWLPDGRLTQASSASPSPKLLPPRVPWLDTAPEPLLPPGPAQLHWPDALTGPEQKELRDALLAALPTRDALARALRFADKHLEQIAKEANLKAMVFELVTTAEAEGWIPQLFDAALAEAPESPALLALAAKRRA